MKKEKPQIRTEEVITYAFRERETGVIVRLDIESNRGGDCCGEETCRLSLDTCLDIFEVKSMKDLAVVMKTNEQWYNSSRTTPMWNGFRPETFDVVRIKHKQVYDSTHGDPIEDTKMIEPVAFPGFADCERLRSRDLPMPLIRRYFGINLTSEQYNEVEFALVSFDDAPNSEDVIGRYLTPGNTMGNTGIIEAIIDLPEGYLVDETALEREKEGKYLMVALLNCGDHQFDLELVTANTMHP